MNSLSSSSCYYDIDDILKEEELVPCTTLFDFSYLAHLDPDYGLYSNHHDPNNDSSSTTGTTTRKETTKTTTTSSSSSSSSSITKSHYLPEGSRIKMPAWAIKKWAMLAFIRLSLPRHYGRKARERLEAAPSEVDLRKRNERFFMAGHMLIELIESSSQKVAQAIQSNLPRTSLLQRNRRNSHYRRHLAALGQVLQEAAEVRKTLLMTYTGQRLRDTLNWSFTTLGEDDVTCYTNKLTEMERRLFMVCSQATVHHYHWKMYGNQRRLWIRPNKNNSNSSHSSGRQNHYHHHNRNNKWVQQRSTTTNNNNHNHKRSSTTTTTSTVTKRYRRNNQ